MDRQGPAAVKALVFVTTKTVRNVAEITSPFMHPGFRPSWHNLNNEKSSHRLAMLRFLVFQIEPIQPKSERLNWGSYFVPVP